MKHGMSHSRIYNTYRDIKARCFNPNKKIYKHYGGRGITVCDEWLGDDGFLHFYQWAIENGYDDSLEIDRIDVNGNYEPSNCRWVNGSVQNTNRRNKGKCEYIGVSESSTGCGYMSSIKWNGKRVFLFYSRSKNKCAEERNKFIVENGLPHPLNDIREEYEDVKPLIQHTFFAKRKKDGETFKFTSLSEIASATKLSKGFIDQCMVGKRNSKDYIFWKV